MRRLLVLSALFVAAFLIAILPSVAPSEIGATSLAQPAGLAAPGRLAAQEGTPAPADVPTPAVDASVLFIENAGQWPEAARYQVWGGPAGTMWLAEDVIWITVLEPEPTPEPGDDPSDRFDPERAAQATEAAPRKGTNIKLSFPGANPHPRLEPFDRRDTHISYFIGNEPEKWRPDVPVWGGVRYVDLYPGVDLVVSAEQGRWDWSLEGESAGAALPQLLIEGGDAVQMPDPNGEQGGGRMVRVATVTGDLVLLLPSSDSPLAVEAATADGAHIDFGTMLAAPDHVTLDNAVSPFDDPSSLIYSTFLGGFERDWGKSLALDSARNAYVGGDTSSTDFPTTPGVFDASLNSAGIFLAKLNPTGASLLYATFLEGSGADYISDLVVDTAGNAYLAGTTSSTDFPVTPGAFATAYNGAPTEVFMVKLNQTGSALVYSTYVGGSSEDTGNGLALDNVGNAYAVGYTYSPNFPVTPGVFRTDHCPLNSFVIKLNAAGSALIYGTFLGCANSQDRLANLADIAVDNTGSAVVTGSTPDGLPTTTGAFDTTFNGGSADAFVAKLNPTGSALMYSTFLGGSRNDSARAITLDSDGSALVIGGTYSSDFPTTPGAYEERCDPISSPFVTKLNPSGSSLAYSTCYWLGLGSLSDIAVDGAGNAHLTGWTGPEYFDRRAVVIKLNLSAFGPAYTRHFPSSVDTQSMGVAVAVDSAGDAYVTGSTTFPGFPTTAGVFDVTHNGESDTFVLKLSIRLPTPRPTPTNTPTPRPTPTNTPTPTPTPTLTPTPSSPPPITFVSIQAKFRHTCAVIPGGKVACWGGDETVPEEVDGITGAVTAVAVGEGHKCVLTSTNGVQCWGYNDSGQLGDGTITPRTTERDTPVNVTGLSSDIIAIAAGNDFTCAVTMGGKALCWGLNNFGQLGDGTYVNRSTPVGVNGLASGVTAIAARDIHACAITSGGIVKCWGRVPTEIEGLPSGITAIAVGKEHYCAVTATGGVKCWGDNYFGQLGDGTTVDSNTPVDVIGLSTGVAAISAARDHTCALTSVGVVKCWGRGALGDGNRYEQHPPVDVINLNSGVKSISAGGGYTCALTSNDKGKCWGANDYGQLGDGTREDRLVPVYVGVHGAFLGSVPVVLTTARQLVGTTGLPRILELRNNGGGPLQIYRTSITSDFRYIDSCPPASYGLPSGARCTVYIAHSPSSSGAAEGTFTITNNSRNEPDVIVTLEGKGAATASDQWNGRGAWLGVSFAVSGGQWRNFTASSCWEISCSPWGGCSCSRYQTDSVAGPGPIHNGRFSYQSFGLSFDAHFISPVEATGIITHPVTGVTWTANPDITQPGVIYPGTGGVATVHDVSAEIMFPFGSATTVTASSLTTLAAPEAPLGDHRFGGRAFRLAAADANGNPVTQFAKPFTMTVRYTEADWQRILIDSEDMLGVYVWTGDQWTQLPACSTCSSTTANYIQVQYDRPGQFALLSPPLGQLSRINLPLVKAE